MRTRDTERVGKTRAAEIDATRHKVSLQQCRYKQRNEKRKQHRNKLTDETRKQDALSGAIFIRCLDSLQIRGDKSVMEGEIRERERGGGGGVERAGHDRMFRNPKS